MITVTPDQVAAVDDTIDANLNDNQTRRYPRTMHGVDAAFPRTPEYAAAITVGDLIERHPYIPKGCDQQGRIQDGARWVGYPDSPPLERYDVITSLLMIAASAVIAIAVVCAFVFAAKHGAFALAEMLWGWL